MLEMVGIVCDCLADGLVPVEPLLERTDTAFGF